MKEKEIVDGAEERIRKYRTGNLAVEVTDKKGRPVPEARIDVRQRRHDFLFGCHIGWRQRTDKEKQTYWNHFKELLNYASVNFSWARLEPEQGKRAYRRVDEMVRLCEKEKMSLQGHLLMWNFCTCSPSWLPEDPEEMLKHCDAHVRDVVSRYRGRIKYYILVNEATDCFREKTGPRAFDTAVTRAWRYAGQIPFSKRFFYIAHQADPDAVQLINDYRLDKAYEKVIEQLVDSRGRPLYDAVGLQSHMHVEYWGAKEIWEVCERFARFDKPLHFTENTQHSGRLRKPRTLFRLRRNPNWKTTKAGEVRQARQAAELYTIIFSHPAVEAFSWFEMIDYGWRGAPGGLLHAEDLSPKPAYEKLHGLIKGQWWTQTQAETDAKGRCSVRAFFGDYDITARRGAARKTIEYHHTKHTKGLVKITL